MQLGAPELLIVLLIVIVLFGVGRIGRIGADLGTAVREFRKGLQPEDEKKPDDSPSTKS
jgi:sec-independent protein translocase protein TatA